MRQQIQRLAAVTLFLALLIAPSTFAENRSSGRTAIEQLAADMRRVFGAPRAAVRQAPDAPSAAASLVDAMNRERKARGLNPLRLNTALSEAAGDRMGDMFAKRYFDHVSPDGMQPFIWASRRGYLYRLIGENLAIGFRGTSVVDGWMRSPGHRDNILQRGFDEVGIAIADGAPQRGYKGPTVVALYGRR